MESCQLGESHPVGLLAVAARLDGFDKARAMDPGYYVEGWCNRIGNCPVQFAGDHG